MSDFIGWLVSVIWSPALVYLCLGAGIYFTVRSRVVQLRQIPTIFKLMFTGKSSREGISSFQALAVSLAGRVGIGNIAGVASAIAFGGPGAVVWMWIVAFLGASTSFVESTLGQAYKEQDSATGQYRGGPAFYLEKAYRHTKAKGLFQVYAAIFAFSIVLSMSFFLPGIQANQIAATMYGAWGLDPLYPAIGLALVLGCIIIGGIKRIAHFASVVVPMMALIYIIVAIIVTFVNIGELGNVITLMFRSAFGLDATFGAIIGSVIVWGVKRGIYSNEAGQGTGPHAAAAAEASHPAKQGLVQAGSVYFDTLFVCSATAFMILSTGSYRVFDGSGKGASVIAEGKGNLAPEADAGAVWAQEGVSSVFPAIGGSFIAISVALFALTTILGAYYIAETNLVYIMRYITQQVVRSVAIRILQVLTIAACFVGALAVYRSLQGAPGFQPILSPDAIPDLGHVWDLGDIGVGVTSWLNIVGILILQNPAFKLLRDYEKQKKSGLDPVFIPQELGIKNVDFWEKRAAENSPSPETHSRQS